MKTICILGNIFRSTSATYSLPTNLIIPAENTVKSNNKDMGTLYHLVSHTDPLFC